MIFTDSGFGRTLGILEKSMGANRMRSAVIANNLANVETPDFKRSEVNFEAELRRALTAEETARQRPPLEARKTNARHYDFPSPKLWQDVTPKRKLDYLSEVNSNGNNVDLEREAQEAAKNGLTYDMLTELVSFQFRQIAAAIR
jgi:flagellar basal-body rod protein FlgB